MLDSYVWWELPGVYRVCEKIAEDLLEMRNVFLILPQFYGPNSVITRQLLNKIIRICQKRGLSNCETVELSAEESSGEYPGDVLVKSIGISLQNPEQATSPDTLLHHQDWPELTVIIGLESLKGDDTARWVRFLNQWTGASQGRSLEGSRHVFLVPVVGNRVPIPKADVRLSVRRFWNTLSQLEMRLVVRRMYKYYMEEEDLFWVESVLVELAGCDPFLLQKLVDEGASDEEAILKVLELYGKQFGFNKQLLQQHNADRLMKLSYTNRTGRRNLGEFEMLWRIGAVAYTPERGLEIHSAAAAILGSIDEIRQRVWRGQTSFLFPILDAVRYDICNYLTKNAGQKWIHYAQCMDPYDVSISNEGPISQFGHLYHVLKSPQLGLGSGKRRDLVKSVGLLLRARNELAHYRYLPRDEFNGVLATISELGDTVLG